MAEQDQQRRQQRQRRPAEPRPLDAAGLQELALGYAARYATTTAKLRRYLVRKLGERRWTPDDPPDIDGLVSRLAGLGYVDDRAWAAMKTRDLTARGLGTRRVRGALAAAGVGRDDAAAVLDESDGRATALATAIAFARRRRLGPFARVPGDDPVQRRRALAAMARAGHAPDVAQRVLAARDAAEAEAMAEDEAR